MKFTNQKFVGLILSLVVLVFQVNAQVSAGDKPISKISREQAYQTLLKVDLFALGGIGYGGETSKGEESLNILLEEKEPIADLKRLIKDATPESGLYALLGLRILKCDCFEEEFKTFLAKPELGERKIWSGTLLVAAGTVQRMEGCIVFSEKRVEVAENIKSGKFDYWIKWKAKLKESKKQSN